MLNQRGQFRLVVATHPCTSRAALRLGAHVRKIPRLARSPVLRRDRLRRRGDRQDHRDQTARHEAPADDRPQIKRFHVLPTFWEPGGEEITAKMKLKRKLISQRYATDVELLYTGAVGPDRRVT
jgi:long-subunit acyl-CoA synthetase (AMP-forming)